MNSGASLDAHRVGAQSADGKTVTDLTAALADSGLNVTSMRKFLELGPKVREIADKAVNNSVYSRPADTVMLRAPIYDRLADSVIIFMSYNQARILRRDIIHSGSCRCFDGPAVRRCCAWE